jgi:phosphoglycolate phosphatase-like HAD superfamily hydrolase
MSGVVLFDWDGTLIDSRDALIGAWHAATYAVLDRRFPATSEEIGLVITQPVREGGVPTAVVTPKVRRRFEADRAGRRGSACAA